MLGENIKTLRKNKGFTQEELAIRLNVVRQTVSKWEKGLSVPDAEMLLKLAEILETSVPQLLGADIYTEKSDSEKNEIAQQLSRINEQLAIKNRRTRKIWKAIGITFLAIVLFNILLIVFATPMYTAKKSVYVEEIVEEETMGEVIEE